MKMVKKQEGNRTVYRMVSDDYVEPSEKQWDIKGDLTTGDVKSIGFVDIPQSKWDKIFKKGEKK